MSAEVLVRTRRFGKAASEWQRFDISDQKVLKARPLDLMPITADLKEHFGDMFPGMKVLFNDDTTVKILEAMGIQSLRRRIIATPASRPDKATQDQANRSPMRE